jgi:hypothetical protein
MTIFLFCVRHSLLLCSHCLQVSNSLGTLQNIEMMSVRSYKGSSYVYLSYEDMDRQSFTHSQTLRSVDACDEPSVQN